MVQTTDLSDLGTIFQPCLFVCVEVLWPSQPIGVMMSIFLSNHTFTGQA